jgi:hypothetical protein
VTGDGPLLPELACVRADICSKLLLGTVAAAEDVMRALNWHCARPGLGGLCAIAISMATALTPTASPAAEPWGAVPVPIQLVLPSYSASGTHQCGGGAPVCVVTGLAFRDCNDAASALRAQDCCASRGGGQASTGFTLNYCIPEQGPQRR